jgi:hypothetical protein
MLKAGTRESEIIAAIRANLASLEAKRFREGM